jgi:hypothetical protein
MEPVQGNAACEAAAVTLNFHGITLDSSLPLPGNGSAAPCCFHHNPWNRGEASELAEFALHTDSRPGCEAVRATATKTIMCIKTQSKNASSTSAQPATAPYVAIASGRCEEIGYRPVMGSQTDFSQCENAAKSTSDSFTNVQAVEVHQSAKWIGE